jgi:hypothetical protein
MATAVAYLDQSPGPEVPFRFHLGDRVVSTIASASLSGVIVWEESDAPRGAFEHNPGRMPPFYRAMLESAAQPSARGRSDRLMSGRGGIPGSHKNPTCMTESRPSRG